MAAVEDRPDESALGADRADGAAQFLVDQGILDRPDVAVPLADVARQEQLVEPVGLNRHLARPRWLLRPVAAELQIDEIAFFRRIGQAAQLAQNGRSRRLRGSAGDAIGEHADMRLGKTRRLEQIAHQLHVVGRAFELQALVERRVIRDADQQRMIFGNGRLGQHGAKDSAAQKFRRTFEDFQVDALLIVNFSRSLSASPSAPASPCRPAAAHCHSR